MSRTKLWSSLVCGGVLLAPLAFLSVLYADDCDFQKVAKHDTRCPDKLSVQKCTGGGLGGTVACVDRKWEHTSRAEFKCISSGTERTYCTDKTDADGEFMEELCWEECKCKNAKGSTEANPICESNSKTLIIHMANLKTTENCAPLPKKDSTGKNN